MMTMTVFLNINMRRSRRALWLTSLVTAFTLVICSGAALSANAASGGDQKGVKSQIFVIGGDGSGKKSLTKRSASSVVVGIGWRPDGSEVAYNLQNLRNGKGAIYAVNPVTAASRKVGAKSNYITYFAWSPDGKMIAYMVNEEVSTVIYVVNADGSSPHRVTSKLGQVNDFSWSPDSRSIAYSATSGIYTVGADGSGRKRLRKPGALREFGLVRWSPAGNTIAFAATSDPESAASAVVLYTMNSDGGAGKRLTGRRSFAGDFKWSPNGESIAYTLARGVASTAALYVANFDGAGKRRVSSSGRAVYDFSWSPDSKRIAYSESSKLTRNSPPLVANIYTVGADGSGRQRITGGATNALYVGWSPAGAQIAYVNLTGTQQACAFTVSVAGCTV